MHAGAWSNLEGNLEGKLVFSELIWGVWQKSNSETMNWMRTVVVLFHEHNQSYQRILLLQWHCGVEVLLLFNNCMFSLQGSTAEYFKGKHDKILLGTSLFCHEKIRSLPSINSIPVIIVWVFPFFRGKFFSLRFSSLLAYPCGHLMLWGIWRGGGFEMPFTMNVLLLLSSSNPPPVQIVLNCLWARSRPFPSLLRAQS